MQWGLDDPYGIRKMIGARAAEVDVVIVGAGIAGATLACLLGRGGAAGHSGRPA